jgi:hypothetical protein
VRRTCHRLKEALLQLIEERSMIASRSHITHHADVDIHLRSHFHPKEELLFDGFEAVVHYCPGPPVAWVSLQPAVAAHIGTQPRFALATLGAARFRHPADDHQILGDIVRLVFEASASPSATREAEAHGSSEHSAVSSRWLRAVVG